MAFVGLDMAVATCDFLGWSANRGWLASTNELDVLEVEPPKVPDLIDAMGMLLPDGCKAAKALVAGSAAALKEENAASPVDGETRAIGSVGFPSRTAPNPLGESSLVMVTVALGVRMAEPLVGLESTIKSVSFGSGVVSPKIVIIAGTRACCRSGPLELNWT